jgi:signal transduction histidine kinase/DNA-binding response OmpR family regulator/ligand-binding sensor domain-containing protein
LVFAGGVQAQSLNFRTWSVREGLPKPGVYSLHEDKRGYLWIGSEGGGAVRFDGRRFEVWDAPSGLGGENVRCMAEDREGRMWFGLANGTLSAFDGQHWQNWPEAGQGATLGAGVRVLRDAELRSLDWDLPSDRVRCLLDVGTDSLWIGTDAGLALWHGNTMRQYGILDGVQPRSTLCLAQSRDGSLWAGTSKGVLRYDGQSFYLYTAANGLLHPRVRAIAEDAFGNVWIGTQAGLSRFDGRQWSGFTEKEGLSYNRVRCLLSDRENNLWIGTYFGGICRYADPAMAHFAYGEGLASPVVQALAEGPAGLAIGSWRGLQILDELGLGAVLDTLSGLPSNRIMALAPSEARPRGAASLQNGWWVATDAPGLYHVDSTGQIQRHPALSDSYIQSLHLDGQGHLHVLTEDGTWRYGQRDHAHGFKPGSEAFQTVHTGIVALCSRMESQGPGPNAASEQAYATAAVAAIDREGRLLQWPQMAAAAAQDSASRFGAAETIASLPDRLPQATAIAYDASGRILVGGKAAAIWRWDKGHWTELHRHSPEGASAMTQDRENTNTANDVQALLQDPGTGDIWASMDHGLYRLRLDGEGLVHDDRHYDETQGFMGIGGLPGAALRDRKGRLWFGGLNGLTRFDPAVERHNSTPARTLITGLFLDRGTIAMVLEAEEEKSSSSAKDPSAKGLSSSTPQVDSWTGLPERLTLRSSQNDLSFRFTGIALETPEAVRYRWRLKGYDADWVDGGHQQQVRYTNLAAGTYTFEVLASNADGLWLGEPARYPFRIRPHWSQSWWGRVGMALLALLLLYAVVRLREAAIHRRAAAQEAKLQAEIDRQTADLEAQKEALEKALEQEEIALDRAADALLHAQDARREAEQALQHTELARKEADEARLQAERSEQVKEDFLANMSHEIRTPMNAIVGMTELLLKKDPAAHQLNYLNAVRRSADNLLVILNDILDLSKIEAGKMTLESIDFALDEVLQGVRDTFMLKASDKQLDLIVERCPNTPDWLQGDPVRLNQVLLNLVGNALKFTEHGSVHVRCSLHEAPEDQTPPVPGESARLFFAVTDTGIGIPEERLDDIFVSFTQASHDTTRRYGGTGLGLSICQRLVEMQGGHIGVRSTVGEGSQFYFDIPYPVVEGPNASGASASGEQGPADIGAARLLLMEDDAFNQMVAVDTLAEYAPQATVEVVGDGKAGVEALEREAFDVVLMDLGMPVMDGYTAAKTIRAHADKRVRQTPLMAMTASVTKSEVDRCYEAGMDEYISKPFDVEVLLAKIKALQGGRPGNASSESKHKEKTQPENTPSEGTHPEGTQLNDEAPKSGPSASLLPIGGALGLVPGLLLQSGGSPWTGLWIVVGLILVGLAVVRLWVRSMIKREASLREHVRRKTRELEKETERALRSEKIKEEFLANMSHEIRTPMNAVVGLTNLLLERDPRPDQLSYLEGVRHSADHLLAVINDILDFSRIEAGKLPIEPQPFRLSSLLQNLDTMLGLKQILVNLGGNAVKFTETGHVHIRADAMPQQPDGRIWIRFSVEDTGIGIPAERLPSMFDMFTQASGDITRKFGGTGLGLAISKRLSDAMGGRIEAESTLGQGSTFSVFLPFDPDPDAAAEAQAEAAGGESAGDGEGHQATPQLPSGLRILLAEDDLFNQMVAVDTLEAHLDDPVVEVAVNGKEALDAMRGSHFDLVLMDIQMPVMDGKEATQLIRKEEEHAGRQRTPILAMTANVLPADRDRAMASGMDDLIPKPFAVEDLLRQMAAVLPQQPSAASEESPFENRNTGTDTGPSDSPEAPEARTSP